MKHIITICILLFSAGNIFSQLSVNDSLYALSIAKTNEKQYAQAIEILNKAIKKSPDDFKLYFKKAEINYQLSNYKNVISDFEKANILEKNCASYQLAECWSQLNNVDKAVDYLRLYLKSKNKLFPGEIRSNSAFSNIENSKKYLQIWNEKHYFGKIAQQTQSVCHARRFFYANKRL